MQTLGGSQRHVSSLWPLTLTPMLLLMVTRTQILLVQFYLTINTVKRWSLSPGGRRGSQPAVPFIPKRVPPHWQSEHIGDRGQLRLRREAEGPSVHKPRNPRGDRGRECRQEGKHWVDHLEGTRVATRARVLALTFPTQHIY